MAFRIRDGEPQINFTHKSHLWHSCCLSACAAKPIEYSPDRASYVVDRSMLDGVFMINDVPAAAALSAYSPPPQDDLVGGSSNLSLAPVQTGMKYGFFNFLVRPLVPTLSMHPYLKLLLPSPFDCSLDVGTFLNKLIPIAFLIAAMQKQDTAVFKYTVWRLCLPKCSRNTLRFGNTFRCVLPSVNLLDKRRQLSGFNYSSHCLCRFHVHRQVANSPAVH